MCFQMQEKARDCMCRPRIHGLGCLLSRIHWQGASGSGPQIGTEQIISCSATARVVQAPTRTGSVGTWTEVLTGRNGTRRPCFSLSLGSGSLYMHSPLFVITPSHHTLQAIHSRNLPKTEPKCLQHTSHKRISPHTPANSENHLHLAAALSQPAGLL